MAPSTANPPTRGHLPIILIRGFGGLSVQDEQRNAYQGFNDGTVYPHKRGENYIYEGFILRFLKSRFAYRDATNVAAYYGGTVPRPSGKDLIDKRLLELGLRVEDFYDDPVVLDPGMALALRTDAEQTAAAMGGDAADRSTRLHRTLWVYRYYDLPERTMKTYARGLVRLIDLIRRLLTDHEGRQPRVNIIAHSMGGLIARHALQIGYPAGDAAQHVNKVVTLGTPHQGIAFQAFESWGITSAKDELEAFSPDGQKNGEKNAWSYKRLPEPRRAADRDGLAGSAIRATQARRLSMVNG